MKLGTMVDIDSRCSTQEPYNSYTNVQ